MAETDEVIPENVRVIHWKDRDFWTLEPDEGQILAMVRMGNLKPSAEMSATRMLATLNRVPRLVEALLARDEDKEWLEDAYIDKTVQIPELPDFCSKIIEAWWVEGTNRATRRRATKATAKKTTATRAR